MRESGLRVGYTLDYSNLRHDASPACPVTQYLALDLSEEVFAREIAPQLAGDELAIEPLMVLDDAHGIPPALWERLRAHLAA